jgi:hypothetical protein
MTRDLIVEYRTPCGEFVRRAVRSLTADEGVVKLTLYCGSVIEIPSWRFERAHYKVAKR